MSGLERRSTSRVFSIQKVAAALLDYVRPWTKLSLRAAAVTRRLNKPKPDWREMEQTTIIREATEADAVVLTEFNRAMARETENLDLNYHTVLAGVNYLLNHPEYGFYVVAEQGNDIAGTLMITYEWSDWRNGLYWWIQSLYVLPHFRRQGIFRRFFQYLAEQAAEHGNVAGIRLYVENDNSIAQEAYESAGMKRTTYTVYEKLYPDKEE
ncbi:MAG TPA: N-acetyltransferase [bacterium]|nr:N-acetyltransferase [bacterium]